MTSMSMGQSEGTWSITTRVIVYSAIGAALYAVLNWTLFAIQIPGTQNVSIRPQYMTATRNSNDAPATHFARRGASSFGPSVRKRANSRQ